jgi:hypothetical protein
MIDTGELVNNNFLDQKTETEKQKNRDRKAKYRDRKANTNSGFKYDMVEVGVAGL